jgi:hypothetical protein
MHEQILRLKMSVGKEYLAQNKSTLSGHFQSVFLEVNGEVIQRIFVESL